VHGEEAYPAEELVRVGAPAAAGAAAGRPGTAPPGEKAAPVRQAEP
jgi:hypothetical protein